MNRPIMRARLMLLGAAVLMLFGGMLFAVARWNSAEVDRAFVEAAARAARQPEAAPLPPRYWAPTASARPGAVATMRIEAAERLRAVPSPPTQPRGAGRQAAGGRAMILAALFILGSAVMLVLAWRALRRPMGADAPEARLVIEAAPGDDIPALRLERGGAVAFGPVEARWAPQPGLAKTLGNPAGAPGRLGGPVMTGTWRVVAMVDLAATDAIGSGLPMLDGRLRDAIGPAAMLLARPEGGAPPILLHGAFSLDAGSIGGIALEAARFSELAAWLGNPEGLRVEVVRRRIQRAGWGSERAHRRRAG